MPAFDHILTLSCPDRPGIVHAVTSIFASHDHNILDLQQFSDPASERFFMRVHFGPAATTTTTTATTTATTGHGDVVDAASTAHLAPALAELAAKYDMTYDVRPAARKTRVLIMVSKIGHCLNDLLFRAKTGQLQIEIPLIVSNHTDLAPLAESYAVPFHHLPITPATKPAQETRLAALVAAHAIELVVLARYMQVLSPSLCADLGGAARIINIHHSFLPSFKGARPYHQAHHRGVKIIGATAHFVTPDLDEGPIIEQRVVRVDHTMDPRRLTDEGSNIESHVLAAAVKSFADGRVFLNGAKTVVF